MFEEKHYSLKQLSEWCGWSVSTLRRKFKDEPGIWPLEGPGKYFGKQKHVSFMVPESVVRLVYGRETGQAVPVMPVKVKPVKSTKSKTPKSKSVQACDLTTA